MARAAFLAASMASMAAMTTSMAAAIMDFIALLALPDCCPAFPADYLHVIAGISTCCCDYHSIWIFLWIWILPIPRGRKG
jgi:hypothetical protein